HGVRMVHAVARPPQTLVVYAVDVVDPLPEVLAGAPPLLRHHQGGEGRRKIEPSAALQEARPALPHDGEPPRLGLHPIELLRRVADDPLRVDDKEKLLVVTEVLRQEVDVLDRPEFSVKVLILT